MYVGIGSNLGDSLQNCLDAVDRVGRIPSCDITGISEWYRTEPVGVDGQEWYVNGVVSLSTDLTARGLMKELLSIEADMGRIRKEKWGPRIIDLDILLFGQDIIRKTGLMIPHPFMHSRRFVMKPMADLAPGLIHPELGLTMLELLQQIPGDEQAVRPVEDR